MSEDIGVYDLGEVQLDDSAAPQRAGSGIRRGNPIPPAPRARSGQNGLAARVDRTGPGLTGSLSLFLPGAGQILAGAPVLGLFFGSGIGFALTALHSLMATRDRLFPTLDLLELPRAAAGAALLALLLGAAALHVAAVVHAHWLHADRHPAAPHPLAAALASALVPGWGQILVGHRARAAFFLGALWLIGVAWLTATPAGLGILRDLGLAVPRGARDGFGPIALVTAPVLVWALATYDAGTGAVARRRAG